MALKSTICKAILHIADMDRNYYDDVQLTIARHPSETDERMMLRLAMFAMHASEHLQFTKGISTQDEPDIWARNLTGEIELWIELGLPEESRIRKACGRARQVLICAYGGRAAPVWWQKHQSIVERFDNLRVIDVAQSSLDELAVLANRSMEFQCTIQEGQLWLSNDQSSLCLEPRQLYPAVRV